MYNGTVRNYWFKPRRFWKVFAAYYPVTWQGFVITIVLLSLAIGLCILITSIITYLIIVLALALIFDILCLQTGEYPSWWKKR